MTLVKAVVTMALVVAIVMGIAIGVTEVLQLACGKQCEPHPFAYAPFIAAGFLILFPALALQLGDIGKATKIVADEIPLLSALKLGRRGTDPVVAAVVSPPASPTDVPPATTRPAPIDTQHEEGP